MLDLRHGQLRTDDCAYSAMLLPELQTLAVENIQGHISDKLKSGIFFSQGPQAIIIDIHIIRL